MHKLIKSKKKLQQLEEKVCKLLNFVLFLQILR